MKDKIQVLVRKLEQENKEISDKLNENTLSEVYHTVFTHNYNVNLDFIKQLQTILDS